MGKLDFEYLNLISSISLRKQPVNIFQLSQYPHWETVTSNIWAYFLNPEKQHNFGALFLEAIFKEIKKSGVINDRELDEIIHSFKHISVNREVVTRDVEKTSKKMKRIDIEIEGDFGGLVLENKIDADPKENDLNVYLEQAKADRINTDKPIYFGFLTQFAIPNAVNDKWSGNPNYFAIRYDDVFNQIVKLLVKYDYGNFDSRSWDIFLQFVENTSLTKNKERLETEIMDLTVGDEIIRNNAKKIEDSKSKVKKINQGIQDTLENLVNNMKQLDDEDILGPKWPTKWPPKDDSGSDMLNFWTFRGNNEGISFKDNIQDKFCIEFYYVRGRSGDTNGKICYKAWIGQDQTKGAILNRFGVPFKTLKELTVNADVKMSFFAD
ncbi:PD-(D/E)XK nuclease family protein [Lactiplantibacillus pentosus]|uniref:PD-(D/E)XK nuclease family protein n=1 Tax=Lactiplantibacillus pentosus TaxID=1589 RepID=UPI003C2AB277